MRSHSDGQGWCCQRCGKDLDIDYGDYCPSCESWLTSQLSYFILALIVALSAFLWSVLS